MSGGSRPMTDPACYRVATLAERWDCSPGKVRRMIEAGELPALRLMGMVRVPAHAVSAYEARCQIAPALCALPAGPSGISTGATAPAAIASLRAHRAARKRSAF